MADWKNAWSNGSAMPPHAFPEALIGSAQFIAEEWIADERMNAMLEARVAHAKLSGRVALSDSLLRPQESTFQLMSDLIWNGFRLRGDRSGRRIPPIPVMEKLLYNEAPKNESELMTLMIQLFAETLYEWIDQYQKLGDKLTGSP